MTKQEKIIEAYGKYFERVEKYLYRDGWLDKLVFQQTDLKYEDISDLDFEHEGNTFCRPKSLVGLEDNNGWLPFTHQKLPPNTDYHVTNSRGQIILLSSNVMNSITINSLADLTHYRPIPIPKLPVY